MAGSDLLKQIEPYIDESSSKQLSLNAHVEILFSESSFQTVLDLGCGPGNSVDFFRQLKSDINWKGLDIEDSREVNSRQRSDADFFSFNGVDMPFEDNSFDLVYSSQVYEHVRHPEALLDEINRVLKPGGVFIGSTSQLEPFHSFSYWNFTPFGFSVLLKDHGFDGIKIYPSIDGLTLIYRRIFGRPGFFMRWWDRESPLNKFISFIGWISRQNHKRINAEKLLYCGQFIFRAKKQISD